MSIQSSSIVDCWARRTYRKQVDYEIPLAGRLDIVHGKLTKIRSSLSHLYKTMHSFLRCSQPRVVFALNIEAVCYVNDECACHPRPTVNSLSSDFQTGGVPADIRKCVFWLVKKTLEQPSRVFGRLRLVLQDGVLVEVLVEGTAVCPPGAVSISQKESSVPARSEARQGWLHSLEAMQKLTARAS